MYESFSRWVDKAFISGIPSNAQAVIFNIYESNNGQWSVEIICSSQYNNKNSDFACFELTDLDTRSHPFSWRENCDWKKAQKKVLSCIKRYLKNGKYARLLKTKKAVCCGFTDGDLKTVYLRKDKNNTKKLSVPVIIYLVCIIVLAVIFVVEIVKGAPPTANLSKFFILFSSFLYGLIKVVIRRKDKKIPLETAYAKNIGNAFADDPKSKKILLSALKDFNENKSNNALKKLADLLAKSKSDEEKQVVHLFTALCYEDLRDNEKAISEYRKMLNIDPCHSTALNNLSRLFSAEGNYDMAIITAQKAISADGKNHFAYNNLAHAYFKLLDTENAKRCAHQALDLKQNFRQAASLLSIIYNAENDRTNGDRYKKIAIALGEKEEDLNNASVIYREQLEAHNETQRKIAAWIEKTKIPCIKLSLGGGKGKSIIGGMINEERPLNSEGEPMNLLAAIFLSELPDNNIFPKKGVLRFYISADDYYGAAIDEYDDGLNKQKGFRILFDNDESLFETSAHNNDNEYFPVIGCFRPSFSLSFDALPIEDHRFATRYETLVQDNVIAAMTEDDIEELASAVNCDGHKMGGYPYFTQEDPRDGNGNYSKYDTLLFQLTSETVDNGLEIMFGDSGVCNFFINGDKLKNSDFSDVLYTWDCY